LGENRIQEAIGVHVTLIEIQIHTEIPV
jgi:hypothetical protein